MNLSKYDRGIETRVRKFNGEYYLIGKGKVYSLNYLGAVVLKYIGSDITVNELSNKISEKYPGTDIETISKDVITFLDFLCNEKLIKLTA